MAGATSEAVIAALGKILAGDGDSFGTFELVGDKNRWVQYGRGGTVNAAYPYSDDPTEMLGGFPDFELLDWTPENFMTVGLDRYEPTSIVEWIDRYFREALNCPANYEVTINLEL